MMPLHYVRDACAASLQTITHKHRNSAQLARHKASTQDMLRRLGGTPCVRSAVNELPQSPGGAGGVGEGGQSAATDSKGGRLRRRCRGSVSLLHCLYSRSVHKLHEEHASAGNRTRVTSMATMYSTTRPLMLTFDAQRLCC